MRLEDREIRDLYHEAVGLAEREAFEEPADFAGWVVQMQLEGKRGPHSLMDMLNHYRHAREMARQERLELLAKIRKTCGRENDLAEDGKGSTVFVSRSKIVAMAREGASVEQIGRTFQMSPELTKMALDAACRPTTPGAHDLMEVKR